MNTMKDIQIGKVSLNMGVGQGGRKLTEAENILEEIAGQEPVRTQAKRSNQTLEIREGAPIGCMVTIRASSAEDVLQELLEVKGREIEESAFGSGGNFSFGIDEHIEIPDMDYDPSVGIFGLNVNVNLERPGYRVKNRRRKPSSISGSHRIDKEEAVEFMEREFGVEVV